MYSRSVEYALRALTYLARQPKGSQKLARQIARSERVPAFFLAKTLQQLARHGMLRSVKGPTGGFALDRPAGKITMMEVVEVLDGADIYVRISSIRPSARSILFEPFLTFGPSMRVTKRWSNTAGMG